MWDDKRPDMGRIGDVVRTFGQRWLNWGERREERETEMEGRYLCGGRRKWMGGKMNGQRTIEQWEAIVPERQLDNRNCHHVPFPSGCSIGELKASTSYKSAPKQRNQMRPMVSCAIEHRDKLRLYDP